MKTSCSGRALSSLGSSGQLTPRCRPEAGDGAGWSPAPALDSPGTDALGPAGPLLARAYSRSNSAPTIVQEYLPARRRDVSLMRWYLSTSPVTLNSAWRNADGSASDTRTPVSP